MGEESEGGFRPGYVLLSFQNLTPSSRQLSEWLPEMNQGHTYPMHADWEIFPIKEVCWRKAQRRGINQNTINPGLALGFPHPPYFTHWIGWRNHPRMSIFDYGWYCTPKSCCWQGMEMEEATPRRRHYVLSQRREQDKDSENDWRVGLTPSIKQEETS